MTPPKLPRLPKAAVSEGNHPYMPWGGLYTGDQMKAYAKRAVQEALQTLEQHDKPEPTPVPTGRD